MYSIQSKRKHSYIFFYMTYYLQPYIIISSTSSQDQSGLKNKELSSILAKVHSKRESIAKGIPDYWRHREEIASTVEKKLGGERRGSDPAPESQARSRQSVQGESSKSLLAGEIIFLSSYSAH